MSADESRLRGHIQLREGAEFDIVRRMLARWRDLSQGIGDDAAILPQTSSGSLVVSTDASVENVHFRREWLTPREIAYRAAAGALSDLAAMGAVPAGMVVALTLPETWRKDLDAIADGLGEAAEVASAPLLGGDLSEGRDLSLVVTVFGNANHPLLRSSARAGDRVYVTGVLGGPAAAISALLAGRTPSPGDRARFARPVPRISEGQWLASHGVAAATDVSDGLAADLSNIAAASGLSVSIDLERIPTVAGISSRDAAGSGEEYELAVTSSQPLDTATFESEFGVRLTEIGSVEAGTPAVRVFDRGVPVAVPSGYVHFR